MWPALLSNNIEPSTPAKFGLGIVQVGFPICALLIGLKNPDSKYLVSAWWLVLHISFTLAELCLSPIGLSAVTKLSIARYVAMMGAWLYQCLRFLFSVGTRHFLLHWRRRRKTDNSGFNALFTELLMYGVGVGIAVLLVSPLVRRLEGRSLDVEFFGRVYKRRDCEAQVTTVTLLLP